MKLYLLHMAIFRSFLFHHHYSAREWDDRIITFVYVLISAATENTICILLHVCFRVGIMRGLWTAFPFVASYMRAHAHGKNILQRNICTKNIQRGEKNVRRLVVFQFSLLLVCSTFGIAAEKVYIWLARLHTLVHSHFALFRHHTSVSVLRRTPSCAQSSKHSHRINIFYWLYGVYSLTDHTISSASPLLIATANRLYSRYILRTHERLQHACT